MKLNCFFIVWIMVFTHLKARRDISITSEMREHFESNQTLGCEQITRKTSKVFPRKNKRFEESKMNKINKETQLDSTIALQENVLKMFEIKCDHNEQYSRRSYLCIHGIEFNLIENDNNF